MKYNREYKDGLHAAILVAAENLASIVGKEGLTNRVMDVEYEYENYEFIVDCTVSNYEYEEETNSQSFNVEIFCFGLPEHKSKVLMNFLNKYVYLETIYKD